MATSSGIGTSDDSEDEIEILENQRTGFGSTAPSKDSLSPAASSSVPNGSGKTIKDDTTSHKVDTSVANVSDDDDDWEIGVLKRLRKKSHRVGLAIDSDDDDWHGKPTSSRSGAHASPSLTSSAAGPSGSKRDGQESVVDLTKDDGWDSDYSPHRESKDRGREQRVQPPLNSFFTT